MTIQQHASFDSSAAELNATSKLVKAWESKNAKNAAKAGGVSLMALSLAACGGSSTTTAVTPVVDTPAVDTPVVVTPVSLALTTGIDTFTGTSADDTFIGTAGGTTATIIAGDSVDGGDGSDTILVSISGATTVAAGMTLAAVETVRIVDTTTVAGTLNLAGSTGIETIDVNASSGNALSVNNVANLVDLNLTNTAGAGTTTLAYAASVVSGAADTQAIVLSNAAATGNVTVAGVETFNVSNSTDGSVLSLVAAAGQTVNLSGAGDSTLTLSNAAHTSLTTVDASAATGDNTITIDPDLAATAITVTGGAGADLIDISAGALGAGDTINGGDGTDTVRYVASTDTNQAAIGGAGATTRATLSNLEVLELQANDDANTGSAHDFSGLDMDTFVGVTSIVLDSNDTEFASDFVLTDVTAAQAGAISIQGVAGTTNGTTVGVTLKDGTGTTDALNVTASVSSGNVVTIGDDGGNIESLTVAMNGNVDSTLTIEPGDFAGSAAADGSITVTGGGAGRTLTVSGTIVSETLNMAGVASDTTVTMGTVNSTVTGGTGDDTITFGTTLTYQDSVNGGAGNDRIVIDPATSITQAPTITNVEELEIGATATVSLVMTGVTIPEIVLQAQNGITNVVTLTNMAGITNVLATAGTGGSLDDVNGLTLSGTGYTGTADAMTFTANTVNDAVTTGAMTLTGIEDLTIAVVGDANDNNLAISTGITGSSLNNIIVTSSGFGSASTSTDIVLGNINDGGSDTVLSFTAAGANTGVSATLADMAAGSTVTGSAFYDTISVAGSATGVIVNGGAGNDTLTAATGATTLNGDAGNDILNGGAGDDLINGGAGNDTIDAGAGADTISGGAGVDTFSHAGDSTTTDGADIISDFTAGAGGDIVDFQTNSSNVAGAGATAGSTFAGAAAGTTVAAGVGVFTIGTNLGSVDLAGLLAAATTDAAVLTTRFTTAGDAAYVLADDGANSYLFFVAEVGGTAGVTAADNDTATLMMTFQGVTDATTLTATNLTDFI